MQKELKTSRRARLTSSGLPRIRNVMTPVLRVMDNSMCVDVWEMTFFTISEALLFPPRTVGFSSWRFGGMSTISWTVEGGMTKQISSRVKITGNIPIFFHLWNIELTRSRLPWRRGTTHRRVALSWRWTIPFTITATLVFIVWPQWLLLLFTRSGRGKSREEFFILNVNGSPLLWRRRRRRWRVFRIRVHRWLNEWIGDGSGC